LERRAKGGEVAIFKLFPVPVAVFDGAGLEMFRDAAECAGRQQVIPPSQAFQLRSQHHRRWRGRWAGE